MQSVTLSLNTPNEEVELHYMADNKAIYLDSKGNGDFYWTTGNRDNGELELVPEVEREALIQVRSFIDNRLRMIDGGGSC